MPPDAILIAGANGAGKTTFARQALRRVHPTAWFLNADEIRNEAPRFAHPIAAGRELLRRTAVAEAARTPFVIETTLSSRMYVRKLVRWRRLGCRTTLHFIELPSEDYAIQRVARRVAAGGHAVPDADVRRRYRRGLRCFLGAARPLADRWYHWLSDEGGLRLVDRSTRRS